MNLEVIILKPLFELLDIEKEMILNWRNDDNVRKWMYNSSLISKKEHLEFINNLKISETSKYFLVQQNDKDLGVIYFTNIDKINKKCEFGLYSNIDLKGVGELLLNKICEYAFENLKIDTLYAEVFHYNKRAINLYKRFGFKYTNTKIINKKEVIYMELKR